MSEEYDVFGNLDEICNNNILGSLKKTLTTNTEPLDEDDIDLQTMLQCDTKKMAPPRRNKAKDCIKEKRLLCSASPSPPSSSQPTQSPPPSLSPPTPPPSLSPPPPPSSLPVTLLQSISAVSVDQPESEVIGRRTRSRGRKGSTLTSNVQNNRPASNRRKRGHNNSNSFTNNNSTVAQTAGVLDVVAPVIENTIMELFNQSQRRRNTRSRATGRGSENDVMRSRRQYIAEVAARSTTVDYVDLVSSPVVRIEGVVNVDSDDESASSNNVSRESSNKSDALDFSFDEENPEISVKVIWNGHPEIFQLRKYQKFAHIFTVLAQRANTNVQNLVFNLNNKIITPEDSPASIDYKIYEFINGRVLESKFDTVMTKSRKSNRNKISLKIQSDQWKRPLKVDLGKTDTFKILYIKCAEELNIPYENFKLSFDGDHLEYTATPADFDLEGDEAIDLRLKK